MGGLCAAVPRFRQAGDRGAQITRELRHGSLGGLVRHAPDGGEHFAARKTLLFTAGHPGLQVLLQGGDHIIMFSRMSGINRARKMNEPGAK